MKPQGSPVSKAGSLSRIFAKVWFCNILCQVNKRRNQVSTMTHSLGCKASACSCCRSSGTYLFWEVCPRLFLLLITQAVLSFIRIQLGFFKQTKFPLFQIKIHSSDTAQKRPQSNITWGKGILTQPLLSQQYFTARKQQPTAKQRPQQDRATLQTPHFARYELITSQSHSAGCKKLRSLQPRP